MPDRKIDPEFERGRGDAKRLWTPKKKESEFKLVKPADIVPKRIAEKDKERSVKEKQLTGMELVNRMFPSKAVPEAQKLKLIDQGINHQISQYLQDSPSFVIGILGRKNIGKTVIANALAGAAFNISSTSGVDLLISNDRVLVLDSEGFEPENPMIHMKRIALLFFNVCDVVLIVRDFNDTEIESAMREMADLRNSDCNPKIIHIFNKAKAEMFDLKAPDEHMIPIFEEMAVPIRATVALERLTNHVLGLDRKPNTEKSWFRSTVSTWTKLH